MQPVSSSAFQSLHLNYIRNSRAIAVLWCVFTVCFAIINIVVFLQPWLGDTEATEKEGYFGLFESCKYESISDGQRILQKVSFNSNNNNNNNTFGVAAGSRVIYKTICEGTWTIISTAVNPAATFFIGFSALINLICIACFLVLFLFINPSIVFGICGILQLISTTCMILGCVIYPNVWDSPRVTEICETSTSYYAGKCQIRWAYILAIIGIFDILFLAVLSLVLSRRQVNNFKISSINYSNSLRSTDNSAYNNDNNIDYQHVSKTRVLN